MKFLIVILASVCCPMIGMGAAPYTASVAAERAPDGVIYRYTVKNVAGGVPAMGFSVGLIADPKVAGEELAQLRSEPVGMTIGECGEVGCQHLTPSTSYGGPPNWEFEFTSFENRSGIYLLDWTTENVDDNLIKSGMQKEFWIKVPKPDISYAKSGFKVYWGFWGSAKPGVLYGQFTPSDISGPDFRLSLDRPELDENNDWNYVNLMWSVSDNLDTAPEVLLENIECLTPDVLQHREQLRAEGMRLDEYPGKTCGADIQGAQFNSPDRQFRLAGKLLAPGEARIYLVTYAAYDVMGNKTIQQKQVVVVPR